MGCWNETCMLTNLPIYHNEQVKLFFLVDHSFSRNYCDPTAYSNPIPILIDATYDEYGNIENFDCSLASLLTNTLLSIADEESIQKHRDERRGMYQTEPDAPMTLFDVVAAGKRCDMRVKVALGFVPTSMELVTPVMIRADAFETIVMQNPNYDIDAEIKKGFDWIDHMMTKEGSETYAVEMLMSPFLETHGRTEYSSVLRPRPLLQQTMMDNNYELARDIVIAVSKFDALDYIMMRTRRVYVAPSGAGSQQHVEDEHLAIARATLRIAEDIEHRWDEEI